MTSQRKIPTAQPTSLVRSKDEVAGFPGLDRVGERFARGLTDMFAGVGYGDAFIKPGPVQMTSVGDWQNNKPLQSAVFRFQMKPVKGNMLMIMPSAIVMQMVDIFYGGDGADGSGPRELSMAELRFLSRIGEQCLPLLVAAWRDVLAIHPVLQGVDTGGGKMPLGKDQDLLAVQSFSIIGGPSATAELSCVFPVSALRPIDALREPLEAEAAPPIDIVWRDRLEEALMQVRFPVRSVFARPEIPLEKLMALSPGDIIPVLMPRQIPVTIGGRLFALGSVGEANGRTAIKIEALQ